MQHTRLPCSSLSPRAYSCPLSWWCHPIISSSFVPFSSCLQSFPASGSLAVCRLFPPSGQSIWASASASVFPMNIQGWFSLGLTGLISLLFKGLSTVFSNTTIQKHQFFCAQPSLWFNSHIHSFISVQLLSLSNSLWPRGLQHARLPCPSWSPGACSNSYPLSCPWCHPTIFSSVVPFSSAFNLFFSPHGRYSDLLMKIWDYSWSSYVFIYHPTSGSEEASWYPGAIFFLFRSRDHLFDASD